MPIGLLEFALVTGGLAGGYTLGSRLRQAAHDDASSADGANTAAAADQPNGPHHLGQNSSSASLHSGLTCTIMLVGEPSVGKSLFLARITSPDGNPGRQAVPKTMVPAWQQADVVLPSQMARQGRVSSAAAAASPPGTPSTSPSQSRWRTCLECTPPQRVHRRRSSGRADTRSNLARHPRR